MALVPLDPDKRSIAVDAGYYQDRPGSTSDQSI